MSLHVHRRIDLTRLADKSEIFKSELRLSEFERLKEFLADDADIVEFELLFRNEGKTTEISGYVKTKLALVCQICLKKLAWPVNSQISLAVVSSIEEADSLPDFYEPLIVDKKGVAIKDIIEDELILALPTIPKHQNCRLAKKPGQKIIKSNPFSILNQLKNHGDH